MNMLVGDVRKLSCQDLQSVQNRIEQCLQHYMNKKEVINTLATRDNVDPRFTETVWQRLEEENPDFFQAYYLKLLVKDQIMEFNKLLSKQVELMHRIGLSGIPPVLASNGLHTSPTIQENLFINCHGNFSEEVYSSFNHTAQQISTTHALQNAGADGMQQYHNSGSAIQSSVHQTVNGSVHRQNIPACPNLFMLQNSNAGSSLKMNGNIRPEAGYTGSSPFNFSPPSNYPESRLLMGDASVSSFSTVESNPQHLNDPLLDGDSSSFGLLQQFPHSFSLPELATDFTCNSDLLENYCRPFIAGNSNTFLDSHGNGEGLNHPESESLRYQCFGDSNQPSGR